MELRRSIVQQRRVICDKAGPASVDAAAPSKVSAPWDRSTCTHDRRLGGIDGHGHALECLGLGTSAASNTLRRTPTMPSGRSLRDKKSSRVTYRELAMLTLVVVVLPDGAEATIIAQHVVCAWWRGHHLGRWSADKSRYLRYVLRGGLRLRSAGERSALDAREVLARGLHPCARTTHAGDCVRAWVTWLGVLRLGALGSLQRRGSGLILGQFPVPVTLA